MTTNVSDIFIVEEDIGTVVMAALIFVHKFDLLFKHIVDS